MLPYLVPAMFISVGWFLHEPATLLMSSLLIFYAIFLAINNSNFRGKIKFLNAIILFVPFSYLISGIINSQSIESLVLGGYKRNYGLASFVAFAIIFIVASAGKTKVKDFVNYGLIGTIVLANIYGYTQYFDKDPFPWSNPLDAVSLTLANPNFASAFFGCTTVAILYKLRQIKILKIRLIFLALVFSSIFLTFQTKSLQGILLILISFSVYLFILNLRKVGNKFRIINYLILISVPALLVVFMSIFRLDRFNKLQDKILTEGSILQRLDYWKTGIKIWYDHFFFGIGADQFQRFAAYYRTPEQVVRDGNLVIPDKAHNVVIDHLANGGIFAGLAWVLFLISIFYCIVRLIKSNIHNIDDVAVLSGIWTAYVFQSMISPDHIVLTVIGVLSAGLLYSIYVSELEIEGTKMIKVQFKNGPLFLKMVIYFLLIFSLFFYSKALSANISGKQIMNGKITGGDNYLNVLNSWPNDELTETMGVDILRDINNCAFVEIIADRLIQIDDRSSQAWYMKAVCANVNRDFLSAIKNIEQSLKFDPLNTFYLVAKAKLEIAANQLDNAASTVAKVKSINPTEAEIAALESSITVLRKKTE